MMHGNMSLKISRNIYRAQQTFEADLLIAALSYIYSDSNLKRE